MCESWRRNLTDFTASSAGINRDLAANSHRHTSFDPEKRAEQEINNFVIEVQLVYEECSQYAKTEAQKAFLAAEMARFQAGYAEKYNTHLAAKGRCFSVMITGGSGFNNSAHSKANRSEDNRYDERQDFKDRAKSAMIRELKKLAVEEAGGELEVLKRKIESAEKCHEAMVTSNKIIKKNGATQAEKEKAIMDTTGFNEETVKKMFVPDYMGNIGFPGWNLQNSNANIHRMKARLVELQAKEAKPSSETAFTGGKICDNAEADRIQIIYESIPDADTRQKLKSAGWKFSPKTKAWQRMRTEASRQSAQRITGGN